MGTYASVADLRAEGVTSGVLSDARAALLLARATNFLDVVLGQWFEPRTTTLALDGNGVALLWLEVPPITLTSVTVDDEEIDLADVIVYGHPDERDNPKLACKSKTKWAKGLRNVVLVGSFGYVEADGTSPPPEIHDVCMRLVLRNAPLLTDTAGQAARQLGDVKSETTDGHSYTRQDRTLSAVGAWRYGGLTGDPEIDTVLRRYRRTFVGRVG